MFRCIEIPKHWRLSLVQVRNVYWLLEFSLRHEERETQFLLCWPFHLTQLTRGASPSSTGLASPRLKNQLASPSAKSQLTAFFKNHQNSQPIASGHNLSHTPVTFSIWGFYYDICDCHILRAWALSALNMFTCTYTLPNSYKSNQTEWWDITNDKW